MVIGGGEGVFIQVGEGNPGVVGYADVLWLIAIGPSVKCIEGNAKVGVSVFDHCELLANDDVNGKFFPNLAAQGVGKSFSRFLFAARKFP